MFFLLVTSYGSNTTVQSTGAFPRTEIVSTFPTAFSQSPHQHDQRKEQNMQMETNEYGRNMGDRFEGELPSCIPTWRCEAKTIGKGRLWHQARFNTSLLQLLGFIMLHKHMRNFARSPNASEMTDMCRYVSPRYQASDTGSRVNISDDVMNLYSTDSNTRMVRTPC